MTITRRLASFVLLAPVVLAGCQQRALHMVEASGERAMERGDFKTAADEYSEVIERRPGRWTARVELAKALLAMEMPAEARENLEVAYTVEPENEEVLNLLAEAMLESGDVGAMTTELRQRARTRNTVGDWMRLGIFLQRAGDLDGAEQALLTAARIDGGRSAPPQMALASLYREAGDEASALRRLRMALYVEPGSEKVQQAIRSYGEIPGPTYVLVPEERE
jgi:Flp pilus assembly protein TadD